MLHYETCDYIFKMLDLQDVVKIMGVSSFFFDIVKTLIGQRVYPPPHKMYEHPFTGLVYDPPPTIPSITKRGAKIWSDSIYELVLNTDDIMSVKDQLKYCRTLHTLTVGHISLLAQFYINPKFFKILNNVYKLEILSNEGYDEEYDDTVELHQDFKYDLTGLVYLHTLELNNIETLFSMNVTKMRFLHTLIIDEYDNFRNTCINMDLREMNNLTNLTLRYLDITLLKVNQRLEELELVSIAPASSTFYNLLTSLNNLQTLILNGFYIDDGAVDLDKIPHMKNLRNIMITMHPYEDYKLMFTTDNWHDYPITLVND